MRTLELTWSRRLRAACQLREILERDGGDERRWLMGRGWKGWKASECAERSNERLKRLNSNKS